MIWTFEIGTDFGKNWKVKGKCNIDSWLTYEQNTTHSFGTEVQRNKIKKENNPTLERANPVPLGYISV